MKCVAPTLLHRFPWRRSYYMSTAHMIQTSPMEIGAEVIKQKMTGVHISLFRGCDTIQSMLLEINVGYVLQFTILTNCGLTAQLADNFGNIATFRSS